MAQEPRQTLSTPHAVEGNGQRELYSVEDPDVTDDQILGRDQNDFRSLAEDCETESSEGVFSTDKGLQKPKKSNSSETGVTPQDI